jgi:hypothetical protein
MTKVSYEEHTPHPCGITITQEGQFYSASRNGKSRIASSPEIAERILIAMGRAPGYGSSSLPRDPSLATMGALPTAGQE